MAEPAVKYDGISFSYDEGQSWALRDVTATIPAGQLTAVIGHTGSGKSTLMGLTDGLLQPQAGQLTVGDLELTASTSPTDLAMLHQRVGFAFQFPEHQLFAETVLADVMFGPQNLGKSAAEAEAAAKAALAELGVAEQLYERSPFELSGGQQRRVALAGVLAMQPEILILDEPTAGLDPSGQAELLALIRRLLDQGLTIILITHQMEHVAELASQVLVLEGGQLAFSGTPRDLFGQPDFLTAHQLSQPAVVSWARRLKWRQRPAELPLTEAQLVRTLAEQLGGKVNE